jgi:hypothetical protein
MVANLAGSLRRELEEMATIFITERLSSRRTGGPAEAPAAEGEFGLLEILSLSNWRRLTLETLAILAAAALFRFCFPHVSEIPGLPHPYWVPVLLISSQYGVVGGALAAVATSIAYVLELPPASAAQDFYAYASTVTLPPALWLATALSIGGLRSLHIHQSAEISDQLAQCKHRGDDLANGLQRALAEITALEQRIAVDTATVAAFTRGLSRIDLSSRTNAAASFGELFRTGTGTSNFTIYLRSNGRYEPVTAFEHNVSRPVASIEPLQENVISELADGGAKGSDPATDPGAHVVLVLPSTSADGKPLAAISYRVPSHAFNDDGFPRRIVDLERAFSAIVSAVPERQA